MKIDSKFLFFMIIVFSIFLHRQISKSVYLEFDLKKNLFDLPILVHRLSTRLKMHEENLNRAYGMFNERIQYYRSLSSKDNIEDNFITNESKQLDINFGASKELRVGCVDGARICYYSLIKIKDISDVIPENSKILSAKLRMIQKGDSDVKRSPCFGKMTVYRLNKPWREGGGDGRTAVNLESSWNDAIKGELSWARPIGFNNTDNLDLGMITHATVVRASDRNVTHDFYFNNHGISVLESIINEKKDNGWIIQPSSDDWPKDLIVSFYSGDDEDDRYRPQLFIEYVEEIVTSTY